MLFSPFLQRLTRSAITIALAAGLLAACQSTPPTPSAHTETPTAAVTQALPASPTSPPATATPLAATPTQPKPSALLVIPAEADPALAEEVKGALQELAAASGYELKLQAKLAAGDLKPGLKVVVSLPPDPGLSQLAASSPQIQFAGVGLSGVQPSANLSVIGSQGSDESQQAFLAGYIAAIVTPDWRVGVLSLNGDPQGEKASEAFQNGARFFCGLCKPAYPPFVSYPTAAAMENPQDWRPAADALLALSVETAYVFPGASSPDLLNYLAKAKVRLLGGLTPPDAVRSGWVATIRFSPVEALRKAWPAWVAGQGSQALPAALTLADISTEALPAGRQRIVQQVLSELASGAIAPNLVPEP